MIPVSENEPKEQEMSTMTRTDSHRPSEINPQDYEALAVFYQGGSEEVHHEFKIDNEEWAKAKESHPSFEGNFERMGSCDHCGTHFAYGYCLLHKPTNELIHVGQICGHDLMGDLIAGLDAKMRRTKKAAAAATARAKKLAQIEAFHAAHPDLLEALHNRNAFGSGLRILLDLEHKLNAYGDLSERQVELAMKISREANERKEQKANDPEEITAPVVEGKGITVAGKVLSTKWQDSDYGGCLKMLVKDDRGFKVWGSVPSALDSSELRGARIEFVANVERSHDDETFGFFKRPRKAVRIEEEEG